MGFCVLVLVSTFLGVPFQVYAFLGLCFWGLCFQNQCFIAYFIAIRKMKTSVSAPKARVYPLF